MIKSNRTADRGTSASKQIAGEKLHTLRYLMVSALPRAIVSVAGEISVA